MSSVFTQGYRYPKDLKQGLRYLYTNVHSYTIHNSEKTETTKYQSTDELINEMWYIIYKHPHVCLLGY